MDLQFYPTPSALASKAWGMFKDRDFARVLEPSAGNGDLAAAHPMDRNHRRVEIDCCEIDITRHPVLRDKGAKVVGFDFLEMKRGDQYSHIIMNPPFAQGCKHVLHAWNILFDGEIVAIINAETVKNPFSAERAHLARLIQAHGRVEYIKDAFLDPDTQRKTDVEVALVHLVKQAETSSLVDDLTDGLSKDERQLREMCERAIGEGMLTGETDAEVEEYSMDAVIQPEPLSEGELASFMLQRIENDDLALEDIPVRLARYGLMEPNAFIDEMRERMELAKETSSSWAVTLTMENGTKFDWTGEADDQDHAEDQAIAEAVAKTGAQVLELVRANKC